MSLLANAYHMMRKDSLRSRLYRGTVVDNEDPKKLRRVKVIIPGRLEGKKEDLPWVTWLAPSALGGGSDQGPTTIPMLGSKLAITLQNGVYAPVYVGYWMDDPSRQEILEDDYPETYGFRDPTGTFWRVNMKKKYTEFVHTSGSYIRFTSEGNVEEYVAGDKIEKIKGNRETFVGGDSTEHITNNDVRSVGGTASLDAKSGYHVVSSTITLNGSAKPVARVDDLLNIPLNKIKTGSPTVYSGGDSSASMATLPSEPVVKPAT